MDGSAVGSCCLLYTSLELRVLPAPVLVLRVKRLRDAAPTHIAGAGFLLLEDVYKRQLMESSAILMSGRHANPLACNPPVQFVQKDV